MVYLSSNNEVIAYQILLKSKFCAGPTPTMAIVSMAPLSVLEPRARAVVELILNGLKNP